MDNFDLRKYLAEGRLLKENNSPEVYSKVLYNNKEYYVAATDKDNDLNFNEKFEEKAEDGATSEKFVVLFNFDKFKNKFTHVTSPFENLGMDQLSDYMKEFGDNIIITHPDKIKTTVA